MLLQTAASEALLETGRAQILDFRLGEAEESFKALARTSDGGAAAYMHLATVAVMKLIITDEERYYASFFAWSDSLKRELADAPASKWRAYLGAEAHLQRALVRAKQHSYLKAALAGRAAYRAFDRTLEAYPEFYEAYKGMGLLHLAIGALPTTYRQFLEMMGYEGGTKMGLDELRLAATQSRFNREEALVYLALADVMLFGSQGDGRDILASLYQTHPESPLFAYLHGYILLSNREAEAAEAVLGIAADVGPGYFPVDYAAYYLGEALFRQNRFAEAELRFRHYLTQHKGDALKALANLRLGQSLEMQGQYAEARRFYKEVRAKREFDSDAVAAREARRRVRAPMGVYERQLLFCRNAFDRAAYEEAEARIMAATEIADAASPSQRAEVAYHLGRTYHASGRLDEALVQYQYVLDHPGDKKAHWAPWSQFYVGEIHLQRGHRQAATVAFEAALAFKGEFDFYQTLEQNSRAALERLQATPAQPIGTTAAQ